MVMSQPVTMERVSESRNVGIITKSHTVVKKLVTSDNHCAYASKYSMSFQMYTSTYYYFKNVTKVTESTLTLIFMMTNT